MSHPNTQPTRRLTSVDVRARKGGAPLVALTAYHAPTARACDPHCDILLVGDSLGMVLYGFDTTLPVTLDMMVLHGAAVARAAQRALVVVDMPFASYEESAEVAYRNAARVLAATGAGAVKLEGGRHMADTISFLTRRGVPVMAHVGLTPQSVNAFGGFKIQGKGAAADAVLADANAVADAGAFAVVLETIPEPLARRITEAVAIPTIGIGASSACDGQILVTEDMLGYGDGAPKFVKRYGDLGQRMADAVAAYADDVRARRFPGDEHTYADPTSDRPGT